MADTQIDFQAFIGFYPVRDLAATRNFYGRLVGLPLARDQGTCLFFRVADAGYVGFCRHDQALPAHPGLILTLVANDVDAAYHRLVEHGVPTEGAPETSETYRIYHFFARDPDGYRVEIQRFLDPL